MNTASPPHAISLSTLPNGMLREQAAILCRHFRQCGEAQGRWFAAAALAERVHALIAPRFVSTLLVVALVLGIAL